MGKIGKKIFSRRQLIFAFFVFLVVVSWSSNSRGQETEKPMWGVSFAGGIDQNARHDLTIVGFVPRVDIPLRLHKSWDFEVEGNFSYYPRKDAKNLYVLGLNVNALFKPLQWKTGCLFLLAGAGLGYNNNTDHNPNTWDIGDSHVNGIVLVGAGIGYYIGKGVWLRAEYRFHHISDPFVNDPGINTHDLMLGLCFSRFPFVSEGTK